MAVTSYLTIDGEILAETRDGLDRDYLPDPLGSVVALLEQNQQKTDAASYWPYGETRAGSTPTSFGFVGTLGYYEDYPGARMYVRARYLRPGLALWPTVDPLWPGQRAYGYAGSNPTTWVDRDGMLFGHGNYCGVRNGNGGTQTPINGVDACCARHDACLASPLDWLNPIEEKMCDCALCNCVSAQISKCGWNLGCWCGALAVQSYACKSCYTNPAGGVLLTLQTCPVAAGCYVLG